MMTAIEPILVENPDRFVIFPIQYPDIWEYYKKHVATFWTAEILDIDKDRNDWDGLKDGERHFISRILSFFAASDGIVNENLATSFMNSVGYSEAKCFYGFQIMMENIHSESYSLLIDTYIRDAKEKELLFKGIENFPAIRKKADWALRWIDEGSFVERLVAFAVVEGLMFSGSFASIFWLRERGLMPGLCQANDLISKDENLHAEFAVYLYRNHIVNKLPSNQLRAIVLDGLAIEKEFITESIPVDLIGMNSRLMNTYLEFVADRLLVMLGEPKEFNVANPLPFMERVALMGKDNFFEKKVTDYNRASVVNAMSNKGGNHNLTTDDF